MLKNIPLFVGYTHGVRGLQNTRSRVSIRINVDPHILGKKLAKRFQDAAIEPAVVLFLEQVQKTGDAHRDRDRLRRVASQIGGKPIVFEIVRDKHRLASSPQQVGPRQEVGKVERVIYQELAQID